MLGRMGVIRENIEKLEAKRKELSRENLMLRGRRGDLMELRVKAVEHSEKQKKCLERLEKREKYVDEVLGPVLQGNETNFKFLKIHLPLFK